MTENIESNCNTISQRGGVERLKGYIESLDSRLAQLEKGVSCLNLTRDLLTDWVYQNTVIRKDELPQYPPEIEIAIKLINLVISDLGLNHDITVDDRKELTLVANMIQDK